MTTIVLLAHGESARLNAARQSVCAALPSLTTTRLERAMAGPIPTRTCLCCKREKPLADFSPSKRGKGGRRSKCKPCRVDLQRNPSPQRVAWLKAWRAKNVEKLRAQRQTPERKAAAAESVRRWKSRPEKWLVTLMSNARYRCAKKGIPFTITPDDVEIVTVCPVFGIPLEMASGSTAGDRNNSPSLDRVDSRKGYVPGNVRMISWRANRLKGDATPEEIAAILSYVRAPVP